MKPKFILPVLFLLFFCCASNNQAAIPAAAEKQTTEPQTVQKQAAPDKITAALEKFDTMVAGAVEEGSHSRIFGAYQSFLKYLEENPVSEDLHKNTAQKIAASFSGYISTIQLQKNTGPAEIVKHGAFKSPFSVTATEKNSQKPVAGIPLTVSYPTAAKNGEYVFEEKVIYTDNAGKAEFIPEFCTFSCNSQITFSLRVPSETKTEKTVAEISLPYRVYTDLRNRGGSIAIVDLNKNGKPLASSSQTSSLLLTALIRQSGFSNIGNSDFTAPVIADNAQNVQRDAAALFGNNVTYLIYGTVTCETAPVDKKTEAVMTAKIRVRNIPKNEELYSAEVTVTTTEDRESTAITAARQKLVNNLAEQLKYGI